jgi:PAS domain-containing protein
MLDNNSKPTHTNGTAAAPFWTLFEQSRIPMALVDDERRYVKVNDALVDLYEYPRS